METTGEKPVLDVRAPGVRVAVFAPSSDGGRWMTAEWRDRMDGPGMLTPFVSRENAERYARFTVWVRHVIGAVCEVHDAVVKIMDSACDACPYRNCKVGCLSAHCPLHCILDCVNKSNLPEKLVKHADWETDDVLRYPHGRRK